MSEHTVSETTSDSSYSDSEGSYTLTTTSDSEDENADETVDANGKTAHKKGTTTFKNWRPDIENGTNVTTSVTPEPAEFLINPSNSGTYKITKCGSVALRNGDVVRIPSPLHLSPQTSGSTMVAAKTWYPSTSSEESKAAKASTRFLALARLRRLPVMRCAATALKEARASKCLGWAVALGEAAASMAVAPVSAVASPFASMCSVPINCVDRALCKGLDIAEVLFPCIVMHPCQMCWRMKTYCANVDVQD
ncbi:hypothetical protein R5R35_002775 [Gryllus longicercus]|uniref:Uncharacterized protein n=1 Tax=Gryllus longicercus TaxID=2509291 RepID=A0AAN9ZDP1_9ORTH